MKVMKKKMLLGVLMCLFLAFFGACGGNSENNSDDTSANSSDDASTTETEELPEEVRTVQRKIDKALEVTNPSYEDLLEIKELYDDLLNAEQEQIENYDQIEEMLELSEEAVACIYATNVLKEDLKNPASLNIISASCAKSSYKETMSVKLDYTADNSVGGAVEDEYYCIVNIPTQDENGNWSCGLDGLFESLQFQEILGGALGGNSSVLSSQGTAKEEYDDDADDAVEVSVAQIMDNLDLSITEVEEEE